jgi:hypothetical protein
MTRTLGAAVGAIIVILFLVTVASRLSAPLPAPSAVEASSGR